MKSAGCVLAFVLGSVPLAARADFALDHPAIELSLTYDHRPVHFPGEREAVIGTSLHVVERNGVLAKFLLMLLTPPDFAPDSPYSVTTRSTYEYLGDGTLRQHITDTYTLKEGYKTEEERAKRHEEKAERARKAMLFNGFHTELQLWFPRDGQSTARGAAFGMTVAVVRNARISLESGLRWQYLRVDGGCGSAAAPLRCTSKFFGVPVTVVVSLGRLGRVEGGVGWNWRKSRLEDTVVQPYPMHLGLTVDLHDRIFVRGRVSTSIEDRGHTGLSVEVGGRI